MIGMLIFSAVLMCWLIFCLIKDDKAKAGYYRYPEYFDKDT